MTDLLPTRLLPYALLAGLLGTVVVTGLTMLGNALVYSEPPTSQEPS